MPRSASPPRRRYEDDRPSTSAHRGYRDEERRRPRDDEERRRPVYRDNGYDHRRREDRSRDQHPRRDDGYQRRSRSPPSSSSRRRSRSPDFSVDRRRERERYDRSTGGGAPPEEGDDDDDEPFIDEPDFTPSGLLAAESNQINGTALKYHEPPEAKKPKRKWRLYVFKDGQELDLLHVSRQSCYLFGRDRAVVDVPLDHTSCSKQHAVLQYRLVVERNEFGDEKRNIKPFILDLESANGTTVNKKAVPASRYYELKNGDTLRFAASEREWVLLCEDV